jgi:hypothetical protein
MKRVVEVNAEKFKGAFAELRRLGDRCRSITSTSTGGSSRPQGA